MKLVGRLSISQIMPVQALLQDLLANGIDLSFLENRNYEPGFGNFIGLRKNHSLSFHVKRSRKPQAVSTKTSA